MKPTKLLLALAVAVLLGACKQKESVVANIDGWGNDSIIALHVFLQVLRVFGFGDTRSREFGKHIEHQLFNCLKQTPLCR